MGSGTIDSEEGEGEYTITVDTGSAILNARSISLSNRLAVAVAEAVGLTTEKTNQQIFYNNALDELNTAIDAYVAILQTGGKGEDESAEVSAKTAATLNAKISLDTATLALNKNTANQDNIQAELDYLSGWDLVEQKTAWCVDYTLEATGDSATIEIPGEPVQVLLAPGCASPVPATDGILTARPAHSPSQLYLNLAILPGWQKFSPTFRVGVISEIDTDLDICTVDLDDAASSAQSLDINQESTLYEVPVTYMTCNATAFEDSDRVVVQFLGQDWEQPTVIGFETNPKPCNDFVVRYHYDTDFVGAGEDPDPQSWEFIFGARADALVAALRLIPKAPVENQTAYPVIIEVRPDGDENFVQMPFYNVISYSPDKPPPYWTNSSSLPGYDPIGWWSDGIWAGTHLARRIFSLWDTSTDFVDWTFFDFEYVDDMAYPASYNQVDHPVYLSMNAQNFDNYVGYGGVFTNFSSDIMEIKIRTQPTFANPEITNTVYAHFSIKRSTSQIYNSAAIDLIGYQVTGYPVTEPVYEWTDYEFPE